MQHGGLHEQVRPKALGAGLLDELDDELRGTHHVEQVSLIITRAHAALYIGSAERRMAARRIQL